MMGTTVIDRAGANNGTAMNVALVPGRVGQAFRFTGTNVIDIPFATALVPMNGLTFEYWMYRDGAQIQWARVGGIQVDHSPNSTWLFGVSTAQGVYFGAFKNQNQAFVDGSQAIPNRAWTHIAGTWDGALMRVYINGVVQPDVAAITPPLNNSAVPFRIGRGSTNNVGFRGDIDELTLYDRALTPLEIQAIAAAGSLGKCK